MLPLQRADGRIVTYSSLRDIGHIASSGLFRRYKRRDGVLAIALAFAML